MYKFLFFIIVIITLISCDKFDKKESIPTYFTVDSLTFTTTYNEGASTQNISDVWVDLDGNFMGVYELPVTFPLLGEQKIHTIRLRAGIKKNGIDASRIAYPFYDSYLIDTTFAENATIRLIPHFEYNKSTVFEWIEDFQDPGFTLNKTSNSDTTLNRVIDETNGANRLGEIVLENTHPQFEYISKNTFTLQAGQTYLELDYKNNQVFTIGLIINNTSSQENISLIMINPKNYLNKIYIDLSYVLSQNLGAIDYGIFFRAVKQDDVDTAKIYIDNIKLVHF